MGELRLLWIKFTDFLIFKGTKNTSFCFFRWLVQVSLLVS